MPYLRIHEETDAQNLSVIQSQFDVRGLDYRFVKADLSTTDAGVSPENILTYVEVVEMNVEEAFDVFYLFDIEMCNALSEEDLALVFPPEQTLVYETPGPLKRFDLGYRILLLVVLPALAFFVYLLWKYRR